MSVALIWGWDARGFYIDSSGVIRAADFSGMVRVCMQRMPFLFLGFVSRLVGIC